MRVVVMIAKGRERLGLPVVPDQMSEPPLVVALFVGSSSFEPAI